MNRRPSRVLASFGAALVIFGCTKTNPVGAQRPQSQQSMQVTSSAFQGGATIPAKYSCNGADMSPPLAWSGAPGNTKSFVLIVSDPDAPSGTFFHWVIYALPANTTALAENASAQHKLPPGSLEEVNDFGKARYKGPCPPPGRPHHYHFVLYSLDIVLEPRDYANHTIIEQAMRGHILAQGELVGTFGR